MILGIRSEISSTGLGFDLGTPTIGGCERPSGQVHRVLRADDVRTPAGAVSIRDQQELSFVAASCQDGDRSAMVELPDSEARLLPAAAIYGANASGKSNVLDALNYMRHAVVFSQRRWEPDEPPPRSPFALCEMGVQPSRFEADILVQGTRYTYGFCVGPAIIESEWLASWSGDERQELYTRNGDVFTFHKGFGGENKQIQELTRKNSLFLSAAAQNNHAGLRPIFGWFQSLHVRRPGAVSWGSLGSWSRFTNMATRLRQPSLFGGQHDIVRMLRAADVGITDLRVREEPDLGDGSSTHSLELQHSAGEGASAWLPFSSESSGTRTLLDLSMLVLPALQGGNVLCIDELESSLHPMLALGIVRLFQDPVSNPKHAQLLFSTHDTNLLGNVIEVPPLRRDQIWFTEKDNTGATKLYSLAEFVSTGAENLERGYLQGRYGAVPFLGELVRHLSTVKGA